MILDLLISNFPWIATLIAGLLAYFSFKANVENKEKLREMGVELEQKQNEHEQEISKLQQASEIDASVMRMSDDELRNGMLQYARDKAS